MLQGLSSSGYRLFAAVAPSTGNRRHVKEGAMRKPKTKKQRAADELSEADLARVVGGTAVVVRPPVVVLPVNKRRRPVGCPVVN